MPERKITDEGLDLLDELADLVRTQREVVRDIEQTVTRARRAGVSWGQLAKVFGVSRQVVQRKYGDLA